MSFGLGLRNEHYAHIIEYQPHVDFFEVITENYLGDGGKPLYYLSQISEKYPITMHGVSLSIGSTAPLDLDYLSRVKNLAQRFKPICISDHLCWTGVNGLNMHDLLPLPYTEESLLNVIDRVKFAQDFLGCQILLENVSSYITYKSSTLEEWEFLNAVAEEADCFILLDINNIYVNAHNHKFDPLTYLSKLSQKRIKQLHLSGHQKNGNTIIDTHDQAIISEVWKLYRSSIEQFGHISTVIERDANIPGFTELENEIRQAKKICQSVSSNQLVGST